MKTNRCVLLMFLLILSCGNQDAARVTELESKVAEIITQSEISAVVNNLFVGTDRRDWSSVKSCFADEVLFDMTSLAGGEPSTLTPQQIVDAWDEGLKGLGAIHHQTGNFSIKVDNQRASVFCYGTAVHYLQNKSGRNTRVFVGSYDFGLENIGGFWKIDSFRFNSKFVEGNQKLQEYSSK